MRRTIMVMALLTAGAYARQAGIYGRDDGETEKLTAALQAARYDVIRLTSSQMGDENQLKACDLVVVPHADIVPVPALTALNGYLQAKKTLLLLGGRPFNELQYSVGEEWLTQAEMLERRANVSTTPVTLPPTATWRHGCRNDAIPSSLDVQGNAIHYQVERLDGWNTYSTVCENLFAEGHGLLCFRAKGNAGTKALYVEIIEKDHSRWCATVELTTEWRKFALSPAEFTFWHDCHPTRPRGGAGDRLKPQEARAINVGLADSHTKWMDASPLEFFMVDIGTAVDNMDDVMTDIVEIPILETFYPAYKQYPLAGRTGCFSTPNRFRGRGFNQQAHWRWRPFRLEQGKLLPEEDLHRPSTLWMTHYLDGVFKDSRVATIAEPVNCQAADYLSAVTQLADRLGRDWELTAGGAEAFGTYPEEDLLLGAEVFANRAPQAGEAWSVRLIVTDAEGREVAARTWDCAVTEGEFPQHLSYSFAWRAPRADADYRVRTQLLSNGRETDAVAHEFHVMPPRETVRANVSGFITVEGDNFMLDGKPWYPVGVNFWTSNIGAMESDDFRRAFLAPGYYDPEQIELDLTAMESVGINMISSQLKGDTGRENTARNLLDFLTRCDRHHIRMNAFLRTANPFGFDEEKSRNILETSELPHIPTIFAYDICWEPGNYVFNDRGRLGFDARWRAWLKERYGSIENAIRDWNWEPNRSADGEVVSPTDVQLKTDGDWRIYVAAYRRFMDDVTSRLWNDATQKLRAMAPYQLFSFRQGNTLPHDFALTGPVKHMDFICPEGYSIPLSEDGYHTAGFLTRFVHHTTGGKPIIWAEFGRHVWNQRFQDVSETAMEASVRYHDLFYRMAVDSGANGTAPWWWPGWYRVNEKSDYGIANPDGTPRAQAHLLDTYGPQLKAPRHYPEGDIPFLVDRDAHAGGYWHLAFNGGRDAYRAARADKRHLKLYSEATGKTSADVPLTAVGNVPCNGTNPPKHLNAEFNWVRCQLEDGTLRIRASVGNLTETTWLASKGAEPQTGDVVLLADGKFACRLSADTVRFGDAMFEFTCPAPADKRPIALQLAAFGRTRFGEIRVVEY